MYTIPNLPILQAILHMSTEPLACRVWCDGKTQLITLAPKPGRQPAPMPVNAGQDGAQAQVLSSVDHPAGAASSYGVLVPWESVDMYDL